MLLTIDGCAIRVAVISAIAIAVSVKKKREIMKSRLKRKVKKANRAIEAYTTFVSEMQSRRVKAGRSRAKHW